MLYSFLYENVHQAQAIALFCMDFRFKDATLEYLKHDLGLADLDIAVLAGAAKNIADPTSPSDFETAMKQIQLSVKLHHIKKIVIIDHADCGAYGGAMAFANSEREREAHVVNLRKSREILREKFSSQEVELIYAALKGNEKRLERV